ncbi:MAG TPA: nitrite/sulfite reductase [Bryobacteraceae bacterium]|jgi:sulfite reductase (ferredoxin)|nr:nitrite/sulfite reductase [Bryobacteraceae bacterium]
MKASNTLWRERIVDQISPELSKEIDVFETEIALKKQGKIDDKVFAETRLRRGCYGQRYDNGRRHDGITTRELSYPSGELTKGPGTVWDAPGMLRIKIPFGGLNTTQLKVLAEVAEEYSDGIAHITTRQDVQLHYIHLDDTPTLMRRLGAVGITTREACGNTVRNVTGCPIAGVCRDEVFDVTPYAKALTYFLLGHPDTQNFGRKFKVSFSGCRDKACALARIHDFGAIAAVREEDGVAKRGFELYVGGGLGPVPYQAKLFTDFLPEEELLPTAQAIARVFARLGERKNRNRARMKFVVDKLGIEEFRRVVAEERKLLAPDPRWTSYLADVPQYQEKPLKEAAPLVQIDGLQPKDFERWQKHNVYRQKQTGYATVTLALPIGDITSNQLRQLADIARKYIRETVRTTVEQNLVLRWVSEADLPALYEELTAAQIGAPVAGTIADVTSCPGTDTCKLGISSSRGLAGELKRRIAAQNGSLPEAVEGLRVKISGCFNSCGQHHIADLGFYGVSRNKNRYAVPHFQVVLGGQWTENAGAYGLAIGAVPSKRVPEALDRISNRYVAERQGDESFQSFIKRIGKAECKRMLEDLMEIPAHEVDASLYTDWADAREFTLGDLGIGECAGEVVSSIEFELTACEREAFEAQLALERGESEKAADGAYHSMLHAAASLLDWRFIAHTADPNNIAEQFRIHFYDTQLFFDPFVGGSFAQYFFRVHEEAGKPSTQDSAHKTVEEAQLFIEACHSCHARLTAQTATPA